MYARSLATLIAVLAAVAALAGCGSDVPSAEGIAEAADATAAKGGAKVSLQQTFASPGSETLSMSGGGVIDSQTRTGHLKLRISGGPGLPSTIDRGRLTQEVIIDRLTIYMRSPLLAEALPGGAQWLKLDLEKLGRAAGIDFSVLAQTGQDPSQSLQLLKALSGEVEKVAREDVRGVSTTHYKATVDLRKYPSVVPAGSRAAAKATIDKTIELTGTRTVPVDVWIDRDNLVRRFQQRLTFQLGGRGMPITQRFELYDFGTKVDVTPPPARQVKDLSGVAGSGLSGSSGSGLSGSSGP